MEMRHITVDAGEDRNWVFSLETPAGPVEIIAQAAKLGYIVIPAGAPCRQGNEETRSARETCVLHSRLVAVS
jgi:hypothetical protein